MSPLHWYVWRRLRTLSRAYPNKVRVLDIGGRKSHCTAGILAQVTVIDLPPKTEIQRTLHLGIDSSTARKIKTRRTNIEHFVLGDMQHPPFQKALFDIVVSVEVLEHVEQDMLFIRQIHRVLKPGGVFLMTTPNGDYVVNRNLDHKRHYTLQHLMSILGSSFSKFEVEYAIRSGWFRRKGLSSWSVKHPMQTILSMGGNFFNLVESSRARLAEQPFYTHHLIATAWK
ncbi:MAG: SAM-dependent methyltransferase [Desulfobacteraceae bacterium]|nr:MAG: SAM-dependent methyltransferase [Desulfobacteraceae bacterium]